MEELGILRSKRNGNLKHFQTNQECPFFEELKGLVLKTSGVAGRIRASLERLAGIEFAFIYGSYAKGEEKADSDVDLLIVKIGVSKNWRRVYFVSTIIIIGRIIRIRHKQQVLNSPKKEDSLWVYGRLNKKSNPQITRLISFIWTFLKSIFVYQRVIDS